MQLLKSMTRLKTITKKKCFKVLFKNRYGLRLFDIERYVIPKFRGVKRKEKGKGKVLIAVFAFVFTPSPLKLITCNKQ